MAKISRVQVGVELSVTLTLNESEARALDGIFGYSVDQFLKVFYEKMGKAYVEPHEAGVRSLHETIRSILSGPLATISKAKMAAQQALISN